MSIQYSILSKSVKSFIEGSLEVKLPTIWTDEKQRWEESEKRREEKRRSKKRKSQKKEDPGARKGRKVPKHCCGCGGSKSRLAKAAGAEPAGQMRDEKLHAVLARSTFRSQKCKKLTVSDHFWKLRCRKSARCCGAKHISKSKCTKHTMYGPLLEVQMSKECTPLWREAHFEVKSVKHWGARSTFGRSDVLLRGRRKGLCTLSKVSKTWGFCGNFKNDGRRGSFEEDLQRCMSRGRRSTRDMFMIKGADFLRGVAFWSIRSSVLGRWFCVTGAALRMIWSFSWQAQYFRQMELKNRKMHWYEAVSSALNFPFSKEVSQNCFVFDVVNFENWGSLAELFRFWCCQVQKLRKSRRIFSFLTLSSSKIEEVSQNCCVFKLAGRQTDRHADEQTDR